MGESVCKSPEFELHSQTEVERMNPEDFLEPEIAITAAVVAAVFSPRVRNLLRRGAIYGLAGVLVAGDAVTSFARNIGQGFQAAAAEPSQATGQPATGPAKTQGAGGWSS